MTTIASNVRALAGGAAVALALNLAWENAAAPLYVGYTGFVRHFGRCLQATLGDLVLLSVIYVAVAVTRQRLLWISDPRPFDVGFVLAIGIVLARAVEWWGLARGRWSYVPNHADRAAAPYRPRAVPPTRGDGDAELRDRAAAHGRNAA